MSFWRPPRSRHVVDMPRAIGYLWTSTQISLPLMYAQPHKACSHCERWRSGGTSAQPSIP